MLGAIGKAKMYKDLVSDLKNAQIKYIKTTFNMMQKVNAERKVQKALDIQRENFLLSAEDNPGLCEVNHVPYGPG